MSKKLSRAYYLEPYKFIRDLVHSYVNLSEFELKIIDKDSFQRLKDVRQLTSQDVFPCARHTRFEHSLGVLELTKKAIKHLNQNGFIDGENPSASIISDKLAFNARLAALLHDVGHCPFSHLGESQFVKKDVKAYLYGLMQNEKYKISDGLKKLFAESEKNNYGSVHEQLSCIVILEEYFDMLNNLTVVATKGSSDNACDIETDFELIIRCILGIEYDISTEERAKECSPQNSLIRLINSNIFDMDKLDYIMRDSFYTSIGTPAIDTSRLFKNMFFDKNYGLIFKSKAVPVLQNMIESRDGLYMYVYNHHAVVLSDFIYIYIIRKLSHNAKAFAELVYSRLSEEEREKYLEKIEMPDIGLISPSYLFSVQAITKKKRSDGDWISLLNTIYYSKTSRSSDVKNYVKDELQNRIRIELQQYNENVSDEKYRISESAISDEGIEQIVERIDKTLKLVESQKTRDFLKPWWKTVFEFTSFLEVHFRDDNVRKKLCKWICKGGKYGLEASEFRSQIAKHVIYITKCLYELKPKNGDILEPLEEGDFFVVQRSNRFYSIDAIGNLNIALKMNEIIDFSDKSVKKVSNYFIKNLTSIIPQKNYSAIYAKEGFYVFSRKLTDDDIEKHKGHYETIEKIFSFVAKNL